MIIKLINHRWIIYVMAILAVTILTLGLTRLNIDKDKPYLNDALSSKWGFITFRLYILLGANVNAQTPNGTTALITASDFGAKKNVSLLLDAGADPNLADNSGWTPLMGIGTNYSDDAYLIAKNLVEHGANYKLVSPDGTSALSRAIDSGDQKLIAYLQSLP